MDPFGHHSLGLADVSSCKYPRQFSPQNVKKQGMANIRESCHTALYLDLDYCQCSGYVRCVGTVRKKPLRASVFVIVIVVRMPEYFSFLLHLLTLQFLRRAWDTPQLSLYDALAQTP